MRKGDPPPMPSRTHGKAHEDGFFAFAQDDLFAMVEEPRERSPRTPRTPRGQTASKDTSSAPSLSSSVSNGPPPPRPALGDSHSRLTSSPPPSRPALSSSPRSASSVKPVANDSPRSAAPKPSLADSQSKISLSSRPAASPRAVVTSSSPTDEAPNFAPPSPRSKLGDSGVAPSAPRPIAKPALGDSRVSLSSSPRSPAPKPPLTDSTGRSLSPRSTASEALPIAPAAPAQKKSTAVSDDSSSAVGTVAFVKPEFHRPSRPVPVPPLIPKLKLEQGAKEPRFCGRCGLEMDENDLNCANCGHVTPNRTPRSVTASPRVTSGSPKPASNLRLTGGAGNSSPKPSGTPRTGTSSPRTKEEVLDELEAELAALSELDVATASKEDKLASSKKKLPPLPPPPPGAKKK